MEDNTVLIPKEYTVVLNGKEYRVYPMKLKDYHRSDKLFSKINDEYLFLNLPTPVTDSLGNVVKDEKGNVKLDYTEGYIEQMLRYGRDYSNLTI